MASPDTPAPPLRPALRLDALPLELLQRIFRASFPGGYTPPTYRIRNRQLRSLCLVSRQIRGAAQPLLWETVEATPKLLDLLRDERDKGERGAVQRTKVMSVADIGVEARMLFGWETEAALSCCPNVVDLRMYGSNEFDITLFRKLSNLRSLNLCEAFLPSPHVPTLPLLEELTIFSAMPSQEFLNAFLRSSVLPSLRALGVAQNPTSDPNLDASFKAQLDIFVTDLVNIDNYGFPNLTVVHEVPLENVYQVFQWASLESPKHLRVACWDEFVPSRSSLWSNSELTCSQPYLNLCELRDKVDTVEEGALLSIDFPDDMKPRMQQFGSIGYIMKEIVDLCEERGARVVWSSRDVANSLVPPETWAMAREARAKAEGKGQK